MCIKWIRENSQNKKIAKHLLVGHLDDNEKEPLLDNKEGIGKLDIGDKAGFKKWYLDEFKEELEDECYKSLINASK
jgi:hypothetical protein